MNSVKRKFIYLIGRNIILRKLSRYKVAYKNINCHTENHSQGFVSLSLTAACRRVDTTPPIGDPQACSITVRKPKPINDHIRTALTPSPSIPTQNIKPAIAHPPKRNIHSLLIPKIAILNFRAQRTGDGRITVYTSFVPSTSPLLRKLLKTWRPCYGVYEKILLDSI